MTQQTPVDTPTAAPAVLLPEQRFASAVVGPSYRFGTKAFTVALVLGILLYGAYVLINRQAGIASSVLWLMAGGAMVMLVTCWYILVGKTTVDAKGVRQEWFFKKDYRWHEIGRARFVRMPFSSRLVIFVGGGPMKAINSGDQKLDQAFIQVANFYQGKS